VKVSLNWLRAMLDLHKTPQEVTDILTSLGLEVEGWDTVKPSLVDLDKVLTSKVLTCAPIPDTDHLSATTVDVGDGTIRSIVCGAPNVAAGQCVLVALPGANVFSKDGQLFTIGTRKVRGVPSEGMICAEDELGIGHDHSGIMVLPDDTPLGVSAAQWLKKESDTIIEIGLTPNRADATNHLGVARDLHAYLRFHENSNTQICVPDTDAFPVSNSDPYSVVVENTEACPRYSGVLIEGVTIKESPEWLQNRLMALGQRPINNIVDITNYVRLELGQPLHAFDAAAIGGQKIVVKTLPEGTVFKTLDEVERKLFAEDLMICDGHGTPMCIGGVFGGSTSGVKDSTTAIFLESAHFNPRWIRRSMLRHSLRTDSAWTFEKGADPNGTLYAMQHAALMILDLAGGRIASGTTDLYPTPVEPVRVSIAFERVNQLIGTNLSPDTIKRILAALNMGTADETDTGLTVLVPTNKPDVLREADVVEEILRVYGLDTVPMPSHLRVSMEISPNPNPDKVRNLIAETLTSQGFYECMNLSLVNAALFSGEKAVLPVPDEQLVRVHNTANKGLDCMRPSLVTSGLDTIRHNQNRQSPDLRLYEFGKVYRRSALVQANQNGQPNPTLPFEEVMRLGVFMTGAYATENWQPSSKKEVDYYTLKRTVDNLLLRLGVSGFQERTVQETSFQFAQRYHRGPQELVTFGKVSPALCKQLDVSGVVFYADFHVENLIKALANQKIQYQEISKYPMVRRDLALVIDRSVAFGDIRQLAGKTVKQNLKSVNLFDIFEDENKLGAGKKSYAVSFVFESIEKTLQDKEIDSLMQQLQQAFETKLNATIRK
jgi:phenylalanyl-tRNA synthetase beta chain